MIRDFRDDFNRRFHVSDYQRLVTTTQARVGYKIGFRIAETPCFVPMAQLSEMARIGAHFTHQLVGNQDYLQTSLASIPIKYRFPGRGQHPHFMTADFGLARLADDTLAPRSVELQAFPSVFGYQTVHSEQYRDVYDLSSSLRYFLNQHTDASF